MGTLSAWFIKHKPSFSDKYAVKIMHKKLEAMEKKLKKNPEDQTYLADMSEVYHMVCDFLNEKGINPNTVV
jgi:hypothetical protein